MADFKPITTPEDFEAAIRERVDRINAKYQDYDELKKKAGESDGLRKSLETANAEIAKLKDAEKSNAEKLANHDKEVGTLRERAEKAEKSLLQRTIAEEAGLPASLASRLAGNTEAEMREDAKNLAQFVSKGSAAPLFRSETPPSGGQGASMKEMLSALNQQFSK